MAKIGKKRSNLNSVEAYACFCNCSCTCNCNPVCPIGGGGITSSELTNQVFTTPANYYLHNLYDQAGIYNFG